MERIGFIGGGQMAEALVKGLLAKGFVNGADVTVSDPSEARRDHLARTYGIRSLDSNAGVAASSRVLVIAVKPQVVRPVLDEISPLVTREHLVISIAAGVRVAAIESSLPSGTRVVRVMPNTPALVMAGAAAICGGSSATGEDLAAAERLFSAVGMAVTVSEGMMDAVTGLSGSGPAYVFTFIEALVDAGVREGLPRSVARELVLQTVIGSAVLCAETGRHTGELRDMVTSPGGTTIEGLHVLEGGAFRGLVMEAVRAATDRSRELAG